jgi:hypothetical protein
MCGIFVVVSKFCLDSFEFDDVQKSVTYYRNIYQQFHGSVSPFSQRTGGKTCECKQKTHCLHMIRVRAHCLHAHTVYTCLERKSLLLICMELFQQSARTSALSPQFSRNKNGRETRARKEKKRLWKSIGLRWWRASHHSARVRSLLISQGGRWRLARRESQ